MCSGAHVHVATITLHGAPEYTARVRTGWLECARNRLKAPPLCTARHCKTRPSMRASGHAGCIAHCTVHRRDALWCEPSLYHSRSRTCCLVSAQRTPSLVHTSQHQRQCAPSGRALVDVRRAAPSKWGNTQKARRPVDAHPGVCACAQKDLNRLAALSVHTSANRVSDIAALSSTTSWSDDVTSCAPYNPEENRHAKDSNKYATSASDGKPES
jgi:hypothetical protein